MTYYNVYLFFKFLISLCKTGKINHENEIKKVGLKKELFPIKKDKKQDKLQMY